MTTVNSPKEAAVAFKIKTSHYIINGCSLAAALAWNEAIKSSIDSIPIIRRQEHVKYVYALIITALVVLIIYLLPDTKSELPRETQDKIDQEQMKQRY